MCFVALQCWDRGESTNYVISLWVHKSFDTQFEQRCWYWLKMDAELLLLFFLVNLVFEHVRSERDII